MAYTFTDNDGAVINIEDALLKEIGGHKYVSINKGVLGDDIYLITYCKLGDFVSVNMSISAEYKYRMEQWELNPQFKQGPWQIIQSPSFGVQNIEGNGKNMGLWGDTCYLMDIVQSGNTYNIYRKEHVTSSGGISVGRYFHNGEIREHELWIPDTVEECVWNNLTDNIYIGKNVRKISFDAKSIQCSDDSVNTSLEEIITITECSITLRNCVNLDTITLGLTDNIKLDLYVDKKYKSLSKKKWTRDDCLYTKLYGQESYRKLDWKGLFNRSISNEADNYMCVQTDEAVVQIPLYMVQDGQSIDVDNALLIKEDDEVYYCPVTKEKTDKSIMAIQSTDCVYYVDSE